MILKAYFVLNFFHIILVYSEQKECRSFDEPISYPAARRNESVVEEYFGEKISDPYRWLEDLNSDETKEYIKAQNEVTEYYLENCPEWHKIHSDLTALQNFSQYSAPFRVGKYYFSMTNTGLQNHNVMSKQNSLDDEPRVVLDLNDWAADGRFEIYKTALSRDGTLIAYTIIESGSDTHKIQIRNVETGKDYPETLYPIQYSLSVSWTIDNKGFFYSRYPNVSTKNENHQVYYHRVGENQNKDTLAFELPDLNPMLNLPTVSHCGKYVILEVSSTKGVYIYVSHLDTDGSTTGKLQPKLVLPPLGGGFTYITNNGTKFIFKTNKNATNFRVVSIDLEDPAEENWVTLVQERPDSVIDSVALVGADKFVIQYLKDALSILKVYSRHTGEFIRDIPIEAGFVSEIYSSESSEFLFSFMTFYKPGIIYRYDVDEPNPKLVVYRENKLTIKGFNESQYETKQVSYHSRDGTKIPMLIFQKKTRTANGLKPLLLKAYGQFGMSTYPFFKLTPFHFVHSFDGIFAYAFVRGGGEYGKKWHQAGKLLNKQNSFDDIQYAAKYLVNHGYTEPKMMSIYGLSAGALLPLVSTIQQPNLFKAAVLDVTLTDMLRYHKFSIGSLWMADFGNPDQEIHFRNIRKYSPLHNVYRPNSTENQYPAMLFLAGDIDNRVYPWHTLKLAATLQRAARNNQFQENPILVRVYKNAGHSTGKSTLRIIEEKADVLTFFYRALNIKDIAKQNKNVARTVTPSIQLMATIFTGFLVLKVVVAM